MSNMDTLKLEPLRVTDCDSGSMKNLKFFKTISEHTSRSGEFNFDTFSKKSK
jgi:hypothetical protein